MDTILVTIDSKSYSIITQKTEDNNILYNAKSITEILKIKNVSAALSTISKSQKFVIKTQTSGGFQNMCYLTTEGAKILICKSRSINKKFISNLFGITTVDISINNYESDFIKKITKVFHKENYIVQYWVDKYKVDLYFLDYKLVIECDETNSHKNKIKDLERENNIKKNLNCAFIRFVPDQPNFCIFEIISKIYYYIAEYCHEK